METEIIKINPNKIKLLKLNARFMENEDYKKLVNNIKIDGKLTSVPFCHITENNEIEVLSGNHRVVASIDAGLKEIEIMLCREKLTKEQCVAIQLSHNSIVGKDDEQTLKQLYEMLDSFDLKEYSGLTDDFNNFCEEIKNDFKSPNLNYQILNLLFLPDEINDINQVLKSVSDILDKNLYLIANINQYDHYLELSEIISKSLCVKNSSTVFLSLLKLAGNHIEELKTVWEGMATDKDFVPLASIIGRSDIEKKDGMILDKALNLMVDKCEIKKSEKQKGLIILAEKYLNY